MSEQNLPIFDLDFALSQFSGNQTLLNKILDKFIEQNENYALELKANLLKDGITDTKRQVHTLKGVAGNLGFKALAAECYKIEPLIDTSTDEAQLQPLLALLKTSINSAKEYCQPESSQTDTANSHVTSAKQQLIAALNSNEFLSDAKLTQYLTDLDLPADDSKKLAEFIDDFNYKSALLMLQ
ncbi:Hpt domain-containing protein [Paraglaciecola sp. L3A3]|uniref:Hpt domain-containing protein n=1 Tax=Paraglaciecola sp. L3A3 TaxID=2686358 RepID=UPI00131DFE7D|nr:Hpt domain-containing protein [Paraglaciecola sp. L3A3]